MSAYVIGKGLFRQRGSRVKPAVAGRDRSVPQAAIDDGVQVMETAVVDGYEEDQGVAEPGPDWRAVQLRILGLSAHAPKDES